MRFRETTVLTTEQLRCLASPVRNEVYSTLRSLGRASVREIAESLGRKPASIHYHVGALETAGLIREVDRRAGPRRPEAIFESALAGAQLPNTDNPEISKLVRGAVLARLRQSMRQFERAAIEGRSPRAIVSASLRLKPEDVATFEAMLEAAAQFAIQARSPEGTPILWTSSLVALPSPSDSVGDLKR